MDLIKDLWRGDVPLVRTYWLFGVVAFIFFNLANALAEWQIDFFVSDLGYAVFLGFTLFQFAYAVFIYIAIWKSANKYQGLKRYVYCAQLSVLLSWGILIKEVLAWINFFTT